MQLAFAKNVLFVPTGNQYRDLVNMSQFSFPIYEYVNIKQL